MRACLCVLLMVWGCDDGAAPVRVDLGPELDAGGEAGVPLDARVGPPLGAPCPDGLCGAGTCADGRCTRPCFDDADCPESGVLCVAGLCAPACAARADCLDGEVCATDGFERGACLPPGPGAAETACTVDGDCASRVCSAGVCLASCDEAACPRETTCLPLHTQAVCVTQGPGPDEAPCARGADCASGVCRGGRCTVTCDPAAPACPHDRVCRAYRTLGLCERPCADSPSCGAGAVCALVGGRRQCTTRGAGEADAACAAATDCASGVCVDGRCAGPCAVDGSCPGGQACVVDLAGATCRPAGQVRVGERCAADATCASGVCAAGRCGASCPTGACPAGLRCTAFLTGAFCFAPCADDGDCAPEAFCNAAFAEGPTCFWRGRQADGGRCARHAECASGRCADGLCRAACADGQCPAGQVCRSFATGAFCSPQPLVEGAACTGDGCAEGLACVAGTCLAACEAGCAAGTACFEGRCHPRCERDSACRPGRICQRIDASRPVCVDPGPLADGAACARSAECASGLCLGQRCRAACEGACADAATRCVPFGGGSAWCLPTGDRETGAPCASDAACAHGLCVGARCAEPCSGAELCPGGTVCRALRAGAFCVARCDPFDAEACGDAVCAPLSGQPEGQCVAAEACTTPACEAPCLTDADCADDATCARHEPGAAFGTCVIAGDAPEGAPCSSDTGCADGVCGARGRCGRACATSDQCRAGARCVDLARNPLRPERVCAPSCEADAACPAGLACRRDGLGRGACW